MPTCSPLTINLARYIFAILTILLFTTITYSQTRHEGWVEEGNFQFSGNSSARVQRSYPGATVTVYITGTTTLASIYSNAATNPTPKSNPFTADSKGFYFFYAFDGTYDIKFSGTGIATPFTITQQMFTKKEMGIINVKDYPYNAVCDGINDDTAEINAAITAASSGETIQLPIGVCLVGDTDAEIFLIEKSIIVQGNGANSVIRVKSTTPNTTDVFHISPPATGIGTYGLSTGANNRGHALKNFTIESEASGVYGRNSIYIEVNTVGKYIHNFEITGMFIHNLNGHAIRMSNEGGPVEPNGTTRINNDGIFLGHIHRNWFWDGIYGLYAGDSIDISNNAFRGSNGELALDIGFVEGASNFSFVHNNVVAMGGVRIKNGAGAIIRDNYIEPFQTGSTGIDGAALSINGSVGLNLVRGTSIIGNTFNVLGSPPLALDAIKLRNTQETFFYGNTFVVVTAGQWDINIDATNNTPIIGANSYSKANSIRNLSPTPVDYVLSSTVPTEIRHTTRIKGADIPSFPALNTGMGVELFFDNNGKAGSSSGGTGVAGVQSFDRDGVVFKDLWLLADKIQLSGQKGVGIDAVTFLNLPASADNFTIIGCSDCTKATPCAGGGTGAFAKRVNGAWDCN